MREIKFRAWDGEAMREVSSLGFYDQSVWFDAGVSDKYGKLLSVKKIPEVKLMQYTGLKDKNDVEIYEGDIAKLTRIIYSDCTRTEIERTATSTGIVMFYRNSWCLIRPLEVGIEFDSLFCFNLKDDPDDPDSDILEKLGNMYDNPELLT